MKCRICDATLAKVEWNNDHNEWDPCGTCLMIISEVFGDEADDESEIILGDATEEELMLLEEDLYGFRPDTSHLKKDLC